MLEYTLNSELLDKIQNGIIEEFTRKLMVANRCGEMGEFLKKCELEESLSNYQEITNEEKEKFSTKPKYVLIAGDNAAHQKEEIYKKFKKYNISPNEVELFLGYKIFKSKSIEDLFAYKHDKYKVILIGETPHKGKDIDKFGSMVTCMESQRLKFPKVERLNSNLTLKFTLDALDKKLESITTEENTNMDTSWSNADTDIF